MIVILLTTASFSGSYLIGFEQSASGIGPQACRKLPDLVEP